MPVSPDSDFMLCFSAAGRDVNVNVNVNVQYLSTRKSCNKELRRLRHEGIVFSKLQNCADFSDGDFRDGGSAFQHMGPETAKAREPYVTLICISIRYSYKLVKMLSVCACGCVFGCYVMAQIVTAAHRDRLAILHAPTYQ